MVYHKKTKTKLEEALSLNSRFKDSGLSQIESKNDTLSKSVLQKRDEEFENVKKQLEQAH